MSVAKESLGTSSIDMLVYDGKMPLDTKTMEVKGGQGVLKRGTVIAFEEEAPGKNGLAWTGVNDEIADCVLCDDLDTGSEALVKFVGHTYRTGHLCRQALYFGAGAPAFSGKAEKQLADAGIYLSNVRL